MLVPLQYLATLLRGEIPVDLVFGKAHAQKVVRVIADDQSVWDAYPTQLGFILPHHLHEGAVI